MGTQNSGTRLSAFSNQLFPAGIDLNRSRITVADGTWVAASAAAFRAGSPVMLDSNGAVVIADGTKRVLGVAKWPKVTLGTAVVVDEEVNFGSAGATATLAHPNISNIAVRSAINGGGTQYTDTVIDTGDDYTVNLTNGTILHIAALSNGDIDPTLPVYVSYTWSLTASDYQFEGLNFWNSNDYWTIQGGFGCVIEAPSKLYVTEYDTRQVYSLTAATSNIYVNSSGLFTTVIGSNLLVGKCISVPSAEDPFLGINFHGQVTANVA